MRSQRSGYATLTLPLGQVKECDTITCAHCMGVRHVKPFCDPADLGGLCKICMGVICEKQECHDRCDHFMKKIERQEAAAHAMRWMKECL